MTYATQTPITKSRMKAHAEGKRAFYNGDFTNPYIPETIAWREWNHGHDVGYLENLDKINEGHDDAG